MWESESASGQGEEGAERRERRETGEDQLQLRGGSGSPRLILKRCDQSR